MKIISGGQTGVDRGALEAALDAGVECGGWCPRGRRAEDGVIANRFPLHETETAEYSERTKRNVLEGDGTLILNRGELGGGTLLTLKLARREGRPFRVVDLDDKPDLEGVANWFFDHRITVLNIAGPRESGRPGIQVDAASYVAALISHLNAVAD